MKSLITILLFLPFVCASTDVPDKAAHPYELVVIANHVVFNSTKGISMQLVIRDFGVKKMIAPRLYWGLSVVWDGKEYERSPKHKRSWHGPYEIIPNSAWHTVFSLSEYLVPANLLTPGRHTIGLKDQFSKSNTLTIFIEPKKQFEAPFPIKVDGRALELKDEGDKVAAPTLADWDGDGRRDLLVGNNAGRMRVFRNRGTDERPEFASPDWFDDLVAGGRIPEG